jgi:capsular polysaccharide biosynthesis protein
MNSNAPRRINPFAAFMLSILVALAAGLAIAVGIVWAFS